jgi:hypothetical protein
MRAAMLVGPTDMGRAGAANSDVQSSAVIKLPLLVSAIPR